MANVRAGRKISAGQKESAEVVWFFIAAGMHLFLWSMLLTIPPIVLIVSSFIFPYHKVSMLREGLR